MKQLLLLERKRVEFLALNAFKVTLGIFILVTLYVVLATGGLGYSEYDNVADGTLDYYSKYRQLAEENTDTLIAYILKGEHNALFDKIQIPALTDDVKVSFVDYRVIFNDFFTSYGATSVRQVIVIEGERKMVISVVWGREGVLSIERTVN